jgi:hypothetical protein
MRRIIRADEDGADVSLLCWVEEAELQEKKS